MARIGRPPKSAEERFHEKYVVDADSGCWLWTGALTDGYGRFRYGTGRATCGAHCYAYELFVGPIPDGLVIRHRCRVRACVNPAHLEAVPRRMNVLQGESFAAIYARATHCVNGHEFTSDNTLIRMNGHRQCRTCLRSRTRVANKRARLRDPEKIRMQDRERQRRLRARKDAS